MRFEKPYRRAKRLLVEKCKWLEKSRSEMRWVGGRGFRREFGRIPGERARVSLALQSGREFTNGTELPFFSSSLQQKRSREREKRKWVCFGFGFNYGSDYVLILFWTCMRVPLVLGEITKRAIGFSKPLHSFPITLTSFMRAIWSEINHREREKGMVHRRSLPIYCLLNLAFKWAPVWWSGFLLNLLQVGPTMDGWLKVEMWTPPGISLFYFLFFGLAPNNNSHHHFEFKWLKSGTEMDMISLSLYFVLCCHIWFWVCILGNKVNGYHYHPWSVGD